MDDSFMMLVNPGDAAARTPKQLALAARAQSRVASLLGADHAKVTQKGSVGPCRICGKPAPLTFEHVPPKSSGNAAPRRGIETLTDLSSPVGEMPSSGWISMQRGVGVIATCRDCNSFSGTHYVPAYSDAVAAVLQALDRFASPKPAAEPPEELSLTLQRINPGAIIRQVLFMIMATSGSAGLTSRYPQLRRIVLDKELLPLPAEMTVRLGLVLTRRIRLNPIMGELDSARDVERALIEVAHMPFAWLAEIGPRSERAAVDVSAWTEYDAADDGEHEVSLTVPVGGLTTALPADYRHRWEIPAEPKP